MRNIIAVIAGLSVFGLCIAGTNKLINLITSGLSHDLSIVMTILI